MPVDVPKAVKNAQIKAVNEIVGAIKRRIQNEGLTSNDIKIGAGYSSGYKRFRIKNGYQVTHIDLTLTGQLIDSFRSGTGLNGDNVVLGFDDPNIRTKTTKEGKVYTANLVDIYTNAERWTKNGAIFQLSESEIKLYNEAFNEYFIEEIKAQRA